MNAYQKQWSKNNARRKREAIEQEKPEQTKSEAQPEPVVEVETKEGGQVVNQVSDENVKQNEHEKKPPIKNIRGRALKECTCGTKFFTLDPEQDFCPECRDLPSTGKEIRL